MATIGRGMSGSKGIMEKYQSHGEHPQAHERRVRFLTRLNLRQTGRGNWMGEVGWLGGGEGRDSDSTGIPSARSIDSDLSPYAESGRSGGSSKGKRRGRWGRKRDKSTMISRAMSAALRHKANQPMGKDGFTPPRAIPKSSGIRENDDTDGDMVSICQGEGGSNKFRFEIRHMFGGKEAIRASKGRAAHMGVSADHMIKRPDLRVGIHGTSSESAHSIVGEGLNRGSRTHIRMCEWG